MFFSLIFIQTQLIPQNQNASEQLFSNSSHWGEPGNFSTYSLNSEREEYFFRNAEEEGCSANNAAQKMIRQPGFLTLTRLGKKKGTHALAPKRTTPMAHTLKPAGQRQKHTRKVEAGGDADMLPIRKTPSAPVYMSQERVTMDMEVVAGGASPS
jgi:hypothetical protein